MTGGFCPSCGKPRTGERFCASCGNDFLRTSEADAPPAQPPTASPAQPAYQPGSIGKATVLASAQNVLSPLAFLVGVVLGGGVWLWLFYGGDQTNIFLWFGGAFVVALIIGWAFSVSVQVFFGKRVVAALTPRASDSTEGGPAPAPGEPKRLGWFGSSAPSVRDHARGRDCRPVAPPWALRPFLRAR